MDILAHGMTAEMNVALLLPFPASNKKIPGFLRFGVGRVFVCVAI